MTEIQQKARELYIALGGYDIETMSTYQVSVLAVMVTELQQSLTEELYLRVLNNLAGLNDDSHKHSEAVQHMDFSKNTGGRLRDMAVLFPSDGLAT